MEEDTGKSLHVGGSTGRIHGATHSLVDYNRAGIPLIEIVTKPMMGAGERAPEIARAYVATLRDLLKALDVSDVRMEQGSMRCDVNLSLMPKDATKLGTRSETKNVNSLRSVERAVRYEVGRHAAVLTAGDTIVQETRHWHEDTGVTTSGRVKSDADDYRYFPEPDLVPVAPSRESRRRAARHAARAAGRPPQAAAGRLGLRRPRDARRRQRRARRARRGDRRRGRLAGGRAQVVVGRGRPPRQRRGPGRADLRRGAGRRARHPSSSSRAWSPRAGSTTRWPARSGRACSPVRARPTEVADARGLELVQDTGALEAAVDAVIAANPDVADKIRDGKVAAVGALIGQVMREMKGQGDAAAARALILERLGQS